MLKTQAIRPACAAEYVKPSADDNRSTRYPKVTAAMPTTVTRSADKS
jgi:hypothetical protein